MCARRRSDDGDDDTAGLAAELSGSDPTPSWMPVMPSATADGPGGRLPEPPPGPDSWKSILSDGATPQRGDDPSARRHTPRGELAARKQELSTPSDDPRDSARDGGTPGMSTSDRFPADPLREGWKQDE